MAQFSMYVLKFNVYITFVWGGGGGLISDSSLSFDSYLVLSEHTPPCPHILALALGHEWRHCRRQRLSRRREKRSVFNLVIGNFNLSKKQVSTKGFHSYNLHERINFELSHKNINRMNHNLLPGEDKLSTF